MLKTTNNPTPQPTPSRPYDIAQYLEAGNNECQDRINVISDEGRKIICIADGAGGTGYGSKAAEHVIKEASRTYKLAHTASDWSGILSSIDQNIPDGQAAALILDIKPGSTTLVSVGDCEAWVFWGPNIIRLSDGQSRKPLLGSKNATPYVKEFGPLDKPLIAGSDGFFKYVKAEQMLPVLLGHQFYEIPRRLADLARLPNGKLQDDLSIVACRLQPPYKTRVRYEI